MQDFKGIDSKFRVCILAAKRAKQLINGSKKRIEFKSENPLSIALEELKQGKLNFDILLEEEKIQKAQLEEIEEEKTPLDMVGFLSKTIPPRPADEDEDEEDEDDLDLDAKAPPIPADDDEEAVAVIEEEE